MSHQDRQHGVVDTKPYIIFYSFHFVLRTSHMGIVSTSLPPSLPLLIPPVLSPILPSSRSFLYTRAHMCIKPAEPIEYCSHVHVSPASKKFLFATGGTITELYSLSKCRE